MKLPIPHSLLIVTVLLGPGCASVSSLSTQAAALTSGTHVSAENKRPLAKAEPTKLANVCLQTAKQLAQREQYDAAIGQFERAATLDTSIDVQHELAVLNGLAGHEAEARLHFAEAIKTQPSNATLLSDYGFFLYSVGDYSAAEQTLRGALSKSDDSSIRANLACVLATSGKHDEASKLFETAGATEEADRAMALLTARAGDLAMARQYCDSSLRVDQNSEVTMSLHERLIATDESPARR